jgi:hypothetical protein
VTNMQLNQISNESRNIEVQLQQSSVSRFQAALDVQDGNNSSDKHNSGSEGEDQSGQQAGVKENWKFKSSDNLNGVLSLFRQSLQNGFPEDDSQAGLIGKLLDAVGNGLQAGKRLKGDDWRFIIRLNPKMLPMTSLEMSCLHNCVGVVLRTSDENSYRTIANALPRLNTLLMHKQLGDGCATVLLVNAEDFL